MMLKPVFNLWQPKQRLRVPIVGHQFLKSQHEMESATIRSKEAAGRRRVLFPTSP